MRSHFAMRQAEPRAPRGSTTTTIVCAQAAPAKQKKVVRDPACPEFFLMTAPLSHKIAVLVFLENAAGEHLLLLRAKPPNLGVWSPIGGKLETSLGESPFECAARETHEETGFNVALGDLHLFAMIAEKAYEGESHWLLFLFRCKKPIPALPSDIAEGRFGFFTRAAV